jgi:DMSO/TMAO reductase YedYZ molybdopterin-dependent catalytic subunit
LPPRPSDSFYPTTRNNKYQAGDRTLTPGAVAGRYNNFYEFTTDKADVARLASKLTIDPWTIEIGGLVQNPFQIGFEDLVKKLPLEERIYRMRCVEAWSMVVPWVGFPFRKFAPNEYSFLSNVDPDVSHPRWSQATERDIGTGLRIPTLKYNGYGELVASMYA